MTREEFIKLLDDNRKRYNIEGNNIIVNDDGPLAFSFLDKGIPPGVIFKNGGFVTLGKTRIIDPSVEFHNSGVVIFDLDGLRYIHNWDGNIEGINDKKMLNLMIKKGIFQ